MFKKVLECELIQFDCTRDNVGYVLSLSRYHPNGWTWHLMRVDGEKWSSVDSSVIHVPTQIEAYETAINAFHAYTYEDARQQFQRAHGITVG